MSSFCHVEAQEVIHALLDSDPDAFDPRADLERLIPHKCPNCGSSNISNEADDEGLLDCFNCGIWFDPLHPENAPQFPGLHCRVSQRGPRNENVDPDDPHDFISRMPLLDPRIVISYSQTTPESAADGDFSESGWIDEEGVSMKPDDIDYEEGIGTADLAAKYLQREGATQASASFFHPGVWYSTGWNTVDYGTGTEEERNYHLKDFTEEEERQVWNLLHPRRQA